MGVVTATPGRTARSFGDATLVSAMVPEVQPNHHVDPVSGRSPAARVMSVDRAKIVEVDDMSPASYVTTARRGERSPPLVLDIAIASMKPMRPLGRTGVKRGVGGSWHGVDTVYGSSPRDRVLRSPAGL
jgi:hypothetical protein